MPNRGSFDDRSGRYREMRDRDEDRDDDQWRPEDRDEWRAPSDSWRGGDQAWRADEEREPWQYGQGPQRRHGIYGSLARYEPRREEAPYPRAYAPSFRGRGPQSYTRSDQRIHEDVCDHLTEDHDVDAHDIEVKVTSGDVTLSGRVVDRWMKYRAEEIAERVAGVKEVTNHIKVAREQDHANARESGSDRGERTERTEHTNPRKNASA
jgi:hypothetical protein